MKNNQRYFHLLLNNKCQQDDDDVLFKFIKKNELFNIYLFDSIKNQEQ